MHSEEEIWLESKSLIQLGVISGAYYSDTLYYCEAEKAFYIDDTYEVHDGGWTHNRNLVYVADERRTIAFGIGCNDISSLRKIRDYMDSDTFNTLFNDEVQNKFARDALKEMRVEFGAMYFRSKDGSEEYLRDANHTIYRKSANEWIFEKDVGVLRKLLDNKDSFEQLEISSANEKYNLNIAIGYFGSH